MPGPRRAAWLASRSTGDHAVVVERRRNAVEDRVRVRVVADGVAWLETTYRVVRGVGRLEVVDRLHKLATTDKEGVFFAFPFALAEPVVTYELTGGVGGPGLPRVPGSAEHFHAVRHWVGLAGREATVAWATREAALVQLGSIALPYPPYPETLAPSAGSVFSWAMNNVWDTNFPVSQGGEAVFAYAIASGAPGTDGRVLGAQTAAALTRPLLGILGSGGNGAPPAHGGFCTVDRPDVEVLALTASRRGSDLVVLLQSVAAQEVEVRVELPGLPVRSLRVGTGLERQLQDVAFDGAARIRIGAGDLRALAIELDRP
jgi:hypothetical protein